MTITKAKNLILAQVEPDNRAGEPQTFLGGLRPYRGILPRQRFHDIMGALRILGPTLGTTALVDRELPGIDLVLDGGAGGLKPTTVIDLTSGTPVIVREGAGDITPFIEGRR